MRFLAIAITAALFIPGCGKGSSETAGIPLSIASSAGATSTPADASKTNSIPTIPQYTAPVQQLLKRADSALKTGKVLVAIESLSQAISLMPEDASLFRMRADVYGVQGENANARADYSTAIRLAPADANLRNHRGYFLMTHGLKAEAKSDFDKAIELDSKNVHAYNNRGLFSLTAQDYKAAEADFTKAIEHNSKDADAWNNRGFARMKSGELNEAMSDIREALKLNEKYVNAWNNCGLISMQQENYVEAEKAFARAAELEPFDARWLNHRKSALLKLNRFEDAQKLNSEIEWLAELATLTQQANRNARNPQIWISRGKLLAEGERHDEAIQDFTRALTVNPGNAEALFERASAWLQKGDFQKAIQDCDQSLVANATHDGYSLRGDLWMKLDNLDLAISDFESARRFDEQVAEAYELRATNAREAGETEKAQADLARAAEIREALKGRPATSTQTRTADDGFDPDKG